MTAPTELEKLAEDWITLWQSELAGLAADPELAEAWASAVALGAAWWRAQEAGFGRLPPAGLFAGNFPWPVVGDGAKPMTNPVTNPWAGPADAAPGGHATPRPAAVGPAPDGQHDAGGGGVDDNALVARLAALERRLAEIEVGSGGAAADPPAPRRRKRKS
jgi:hypothetical protein